MVLAQKRRAVFRLLVIDQGHLELDWLNGLSLEPGARVEIVDLGLRCDVIVTQGRARVAAMGDRHTRDRLVWTNRRKRSPLVGMALNILEARLPGSAELVVGQISEELRNISAMQPDAFWVRNSE